MHPLEGGEPPSGTFEDHGYGFVTFFKAPGDFAVQLYQAKYSKQTS